MTNEASYDSRAVANKILEIARKKNLKLTVMQLLKVMFFAHAWSLVFLNRPLSRHHVQAWQYGPVFPLVYRAYPGMGSRTVDSEIVEKQTGIPFGADFDEAAQQIVESIVDGYGRDLGFALSRQTHVEGGPWDVTVKTKGLYHDIDNDLIKSYYSKFVKNESSRTSQ